MAPSPSSRSSVFRALYGDGEPKWGRDPADFDPDKVAELLPHLGRIFGPGRYFEMQVNGFENLPESPVMLVSNHSGGTSIPDVWGFMVSWYQRFGAQRPLHALAHDMVFTVPAIGRFFAQGGILRASRDQARRVLTEHRRDIMVMPGGDRDTWRTWNQRYTVNFAGRKGYARAALEAGVPIVPVANAGAHQTLVVLADGHGLARRAGLHRIARAEVWPVHLSFPWGVGVGPLPHMPTPSFLRYQIGKPVQPPIAVAPGEPASQAAIDAYDRAVRDAVQAQLDQLKHDRPRLDERVVRRARGVRTRLRSVRDRMQR